MSRPILLPVPNPPSDGQLVVRALEGDRFGLELIYRRHASYLLGMTTRLLASRAEAEEVVSETFAIGVRQLQTLTEPAALRGWLSRIAIGLTRQRLRRPRWLPWSLPFFGRSHRTEDAALVALAAPDLRADDRDELALVDRVLARAHPERRVAWMLRRVEGFELDDVAAACACSATTARRRIADIDADIDAVTDPPAARTPEAS
jgi:RNA polymerase sigma-70 factor (ECF subfamily)